MTDLEVGRRPGANPDTDLADDANASDPDETQAVLAPPSVETPAIVAPDDGSDGSSPEPAPATDAGAETGDSGDAQGGTTSTAPVANHRGRRRRIVLLMILAVAATGLILFSAWYLITRKPISELPLPGLTVEQVPHYAFSVYGVTAPTGVAVTADGSRIYVTQTEVDPAVLVFDGKGTLLGRLDPPATTGSSHVPVYVAINPTNGDVYVSDRPTGSVLVFDADGAFVRVFEPGKSLTGWQPLGLGFNPAGHLLVTDVSGPFNTVHEFDPDGSLVRTIGEAGMFNFPNGVATDAEGNVYVTDSNNGRLVVFDPSGRQRSMVRRGSAAGDLGLPRGTAIDDSGRVYVVDTSGQGVQVYHVVGSEDAPLAYIGKFGAAGTDDGAFQYPNGVAVDDRARVYITDWRNNRVQVWTY